MNVANNVLNPIFVRAFEDGLFLNKDVFEIDASARQRIRLEKSITVTFTDEKPGKHVVTREEFRYFIQSLVNDVKDFVERSTGKSIRASLLTITPDQEALSDVVFRMMQFFDTLPSGKCVSNVYVNLPTPAITESDNSATVRFIVDFAKFSKKVTLKANFTLRSGPVW